jgi:hypothetical protein
MTEKQRKILTGFGSVALVSFWVEGFWTLSPASAPITASRHLVPRWSFVFSTLLLLANLADWSILILHRSRLSSAGSLAKVQRVSAIKKVAVAVFSLLILWLRVTFETVLPVLLPPVELWFLALALAWMLTPFASLGWMYIGMRLNSWFDRRE